MPTLVIETEINAPPDICFDLVREISLNFSNDKTFGNKPFLGETVTFESKKFGIRQELTVKVVEFEKPFLFTDEMIRGKLESFRHTHEFIPDTNKTLMRDTLVWSSPYGAVGRLFDLLILKKHLQKTVRRRNEKLKETAEKVYKSENKIN